MVIAFTLASILAGCVIAQAAGPISPLRAILEAQHIGASSVTSSGIGWRTWGGNNYDEGWGVAVAADGSVYLAGFTNSTGAGSLDAFLTKYDHIGTQLWTRTWGGEDDDRGWGVAVATDGSVYLVGGTSSFGMGGDDDAILVKYDAAGTLLWTRTWSGANEDCGRGVAVATDGSVYLVGYTSSFGAGNDDAFIAKYNSTGTQLWNCTWGGPSNEYGHGVTVAANGSVYFAGFTQSFGAGFGDAFLATYSANGTQMWNRTWGGAYDDYGLGVAKMVDESIYFTGFTSNFGAGGVDAFLVKYDAAGMQSWNRTWGGTNGDLGTGVAVADNESIYVGGVTSSFGAGNDDAFIAKYDATGTQSWNRTWGGVNADPGSGVAVAADGSVYLTGKTSSFGAGNDDAFLATYDAVGNPLWPAVPATPPAPDYFILVLVLVVGAGLVFVAVLLWNHRRRSQFNS